MFRKDLITIKEWIENSNKALLVTGARQIGKTWLIRDVEEISHLFLYKKMYIRDVIIEKN